MLFLFSPLHNIIFPLIMQAEEKLFSMPLVGSWNMEPDADTGYPRITHFLPRS